MSDPCITVAKTENGGLRITIRAQTEIELALAPGVDMSAEFLADVIAARMSLQVREDWRPAIERQLADEMPKVLAGASQSRHRETGRTSQAADQAGKREHQETAPKAGTLPD